jgi:hypothetical protein
VWEGEKERRTELYTQPDAIAEHVTSHVSVPCFPTTYVPGLLVLAPSTESKQTTKPKHQTSKPNHTKPRASYMQATHQLAAVRLRTVGSKLVRVHVIHPKLLLFH